MKGSIATVCLLGVVLWLALSVGTAGPAGPGAPLAPSIDGGHAR